MRPKKSQSGLGHKGLVFCRNKINGWLMKNIDKGLTVPKWLLINRPKILPNAPKFICSNCLGFWWKKASLGVHIPCPWGMSQKKQLCCAAFMKRFSEGTFSTPIPELTWHTDLFLECKCTYVYYFFHKNTNNRMSTKKKEAKPIFKWK